ncbi:GntR family transcriptional regulator [Erwinia typographi]|uniref:GntR family transcriptional regulator n=1 Tax=Erwinia typographi TaxID=371042 RepID=A0A0A4A900_9GAMM|nr:PLP-dependent aminotransferase family protein [Erwinia typographi]KGT94308.1 GntR family transcriptional regulator [Erwinia typographi]
MTQNPTRIALVMNEVRTKIAARSYLPGSRLPSVRAQARALGVSVSTVVEGYERLVAENAILSRPGAGFFVSGPVAPLDLAQIGPRLDRDIDPLWMSRQSLETDESILKPGCGWLPPSWMFEQGIRRAMWALARGSTTGLTDYATPPGHAGLRQLLARRMRLAGVEADTSRVLLTESGTQAVDLICRFLLEPGDTVLVDDPCYFNFHALLKAHRVNVVGIPYTANGPDLQAFELALLQHAPRLYLTNSGIHNPTGATLSPVTAHRLLRMAETANLTIVEDDIFADFEVSPAPRLAAFDGLSRVILIGSFSKTVSASIRCGFIAARADWVESLTDLKIATSFGGGRLASELLLLTLTDSGYRRHRESVRQRLAQAMAQTVERLQPLGIVPWLMPQAGMFLWCQLPAGADATTVSRRCLQEGVVLAPGNTFSQRQAAGDFMRFNVSQCTDKRIFEVLAKALR